MSIIPQWSEFRNNYENNLIVTSVRGKKSNVKVLSVLAFILCAVPKLRPIGTLPLYVVDLIILYLLIKTLGRKHLVNRGFAKIILFLSSIYALFVIMGEFHGAIIYGYIFESMYILARVLLAVSLVYIVPRIIVSIEDLKLIAKGIFSGIFVSAIISLLYSFSFTRFLVEPLFSIKQLEANSENILDVGETKLNMFDGDLRGRTLIGVSTISAGVMATFWPLTFLFSKLTTFKDGFFWSNFVKIVTIYVVPLGILATYGRSAWLSIILIIFSFIVWGSSKHKAQLVTLFLLLVISINSLGIDRIVDNLPLLNRVFKATEKTVTDPVATNSEQERFLAYVEPFEHVINYPIFLIAGSGSAQRKWSGNFYQEAETASHAIPGMSYYAYGVGGSLCQIGLMLSAFFLSVQRIKESKQKLSEMLWVWRCLLGSWFGVLPWWLFAHGIVTQPHGTMLYFLYFGILLACDSIQTFSLRTRKRC